MKAGIKEIFASIQGEGKYVGAPQVFVRFAGCDMNCIWCDTPKKKGVLKILSVKQIIKEVTRIKKGCRTVSLTGGEPLQQTDFLKELLPELKEKNFLTYLETNGVHAKALKRIIRYVDIIAMDIKLPSSTRQKAFWNEHEEFLNVARQKEVFVKVVITLETTKKDILKAARLTAGVSVDTPFFLQPNTDELGKVLMLKCLDFQKSCLRHLSDVRIIPQMHKMMGWR